MTVRVGVLGVAGMGLYHLITIPRVEGYELTAICDSWPKALDNALGLAPEAKAFADPDDLWSSGSVDAVVIASPNTKHAEHAEAALETGLHVYCEKPLATTAEECRRIAELAVSYGRRLQVGFQHRFQPSYATAKRLVDNGSVGTLRRVSLCSTDWFRTDAYFSKRPWRGRWAEAGGGVLMSQAIHHLDALCWMTGPPSSVWARAWSTRPEIEVEDDVYAVLELAGGARGQITASTIEPAGRSLIELSGEQAVLRAENDELLVGRPPQDIAAVMREQSADYSSVEMSWEHAVAAEAGQDADAVFDRCVLDCHRDFLAAIEEGREPLNNGEEATRSVELANACYLSAITGEPAGLPLDTAAYREVFGKLCSGELSLPTAG